MNSTQSPIDFGEMESWQDNPRVGSGRGRTTPGTPILHPREVGIPAPVNLLQGYTTSRNINGAGYSQVNLSHVVATNDDAFHHANIWATGYLGNPNPQLVSGSTSGNHSFLLPATGENVAFTVQSIGKDGSHLPLSKCPTTSHTLK